MNEQDVLRVVEDFGRKLPKFHDGRIDYSTSDTAPVVTVFVKHRDEILLVKRGSKVRTHHEKWDTVAGYLDEVKPIRMKVLEEIQEECGIEESHISSIHVGKIYECVEEEKNGVVVPVLVELRSRPDVKLDWEHTEYRWVGLQELKGKKRTPLFAGIAYHLERSSLL